MRRCKKSRICSLLATEKPPPKQPLHAYVVTSISSQSHLRSSLRASNTSATQRAATCGMHNVSLKDQPFLPNQGRKGFFMLCLCSSLSRLRESSRRRAKNYDYSD